MSQQPPPPAERSEPPAPTSPAGPAQPARSGPPAGYAGAAGPSGPRANFGQRLLAALIDSVLLAIVGSLIRALFGDDLGSFINFVLGLAYIVYLEGSPSGQTVGKKVLNIRVVDFDTGGPIGYGRAAIRYFARILSALPCLLGYFWMIWDRERQTWHDKLSTSVVVPTSAYPVSDWPG
jgi:uncharacterized RDD family membrane protein YckC